MSKQKIKLSKRDKAFLQKEKKKAATERIFTRINILTLSHEGKKDTDIATFLKVSRTTVWSVKQRYREGGIKRAVYDNPRPGQPKRYTVKHETELTALACSKPPEGRTRWTGELLMEQMRRAIEGCKTISESMVRLMLKKRMQTLVKEDVVYRED